MDSQWRRAYQIFLLKKKIIIKKKGPTTVQIYKLENIEHKSMK